MIELLPGFRITADRVRGQLEDGVSVLVTRGEVSDDRIAESIVHLMGLEHSSVFLREEIEPQGGASGVAKYIASLLDDSDSPRGFSVGGILESGLLEYRTIVADSFDLGSAKAWIDFMEEFGQLGPRIDPSRRPVFLVSLPFEVLLQFSLPRATNIMRVLDWRSVFSEADATVAAMHLIAESSGTAIERALKSSVISAIAGVDFGLAQFLGEYGIESFDEMYRLIDQHRQRNMDDYPYLSGNSLSQAEQGGYRLNDGSFARHIYAYGAASEIQKEIDRRLWHAEIKVLFPFLEAKRRKLIEENHARFSVPHLRPGGETVDNVGDLEFGDMAHQLRQRRVGYFDRTIEQVEFLRETRNRLAHFRPVSFQCLVENRQWLY
jgi:hypothetical protein